MLLQYQRKVDANIYIYALTYIHTYIHTYKHAYIPIYILTYLHSYKHKPEMFQRVSLNNTNGNQVMTFSRV